MQFPPNENILFALVQTVFILREKTLDMVQSLKGEAYGISSVVYEVLFLRYQVWELWYWDIRACKEKLVIYLLAWYFQLSLVVNRQSCIEASRVLAAKQK